MQAEIISIGDELTSGQRLDTNSQWLSQQLGDLGVEVLYHTTVADQLDANMAAFRQASQRVDLVVCTGGLGPTADDLTRQAIAEAMQLELVQDAGAMAHIENLFRQRGRSMPESNIIQSMFPTGSQVIPNPHGSAPGIDLPVPGGNCRIFALPGVPAEMKEMWEATVRPTIESLLPDDRETICHYRLKCFGIGESDLEQMLPDLIRRGREPSVGITVSKATITLRVSARGIDESDCREKMQSTIDTIHDCLGDLVFGEEDDELEDVVVGQLRVRETTLSTLEWGTGGILAGWLAAVEGSRSVYRGGQITTSWEPLSSKMNTLGREASVEADSAEAIAVAAQWTRDFYRTDFALAVGPVQENSADSLDRHIEMALAGPQGVIQQRFPYRGHPDILQARAAKQALDLLRRNLADKDHVSP